MESAFFFYGSLYPTVFSAFWNNLCCIIVVEEQRSVSKLYFPLFPSLPNHHFISCKLLKVDNTGARQGLGSWFRGKGASTSAVIGNSKLQHKAYCRTSLFAFRHSKDEDVISARPGVHVSAASSSPVWLLSELQKPQLPIPPPTPSDPPSPSIQLLYFLSEDIQLPALLVWNRRCPFEAGPQVFQEVTRCYSGALESSLVVLLHWLSMLIFSGYFGIVCL